VALNNELKFEYMKTEEKEKLQKEIDRLQAKLNKLGNNQSYEVGKWYIAECCGVSGYLMLLDKTEYSGYFAAKCWVYKNREMSFGNGNFDKIERPATNEEVEAALIAEAKRRGFKKDVTITNLHFSNSNDYCISCNPYKLLHDEFYLSEDMSYLSFGGAFIFKNGKWAKIIENSPLKINGYEMEVDGSEVKFGCARFRKNSLIQLSEKIREFGKGEPNGFRIISSIKLDSGVEITVEQLKQITDELNKTK
jgi:hypothetical protein